MCPFKLFVANGNHFNLYSFFNVVTDMHRFFDVRPSPPSLRMKPGSMLRLSFWLRYAMSLARVSKCITMEYLLHAMTTHEIFVGFTFVDRGCS